MSSSPPAWPRYWGRRRGARDQEQVWQLLAAPQEAPGKPGPRPNRKLPLSSQYADPVTDLLDRCGVFRARLFRESCVFHQGCYVKDLSRLGRDLRKTLILDNSPASYIFHPENAVSGPHTHAAGLGRAPVLGGEGRRGGGSCGLYWSGAAARVNGPGSRGSGAGDSGCPLPPQVPVQSWFDDMADTELLNLIPIFEELSGAEDVYTSLGQLRAP